MRYEGEDNVQEPLGIARRLLVLASAAQAASAEAAGTLGVGDDEDLFEVFSQISSL